MCYQGKMINQADGCGYSNTPTYCQYNQVVKTYNVEDIPHQINYHTHVINDCIKRHINIPTYTQSFENVYYDQYITEAPVYPVPLMYNQGMCNKGMYQMPNQYQPQMEMPQNPFGIYNS